MSDFLCLRFKDVALTRLSKVAWSVLAADGRIQASGYSLLKDIGESVPEAEGARRNIIIVPSASVLLSYVDIPAKQHRHLKQVLGFVVEEQIIDPIESMHLSTPAFHVGDTVHVAAIKREILDTWLDVLSSIQVLPDYLFVDALCVPQKLGDWQLLFENHHVLLRESNYRGMALDKQTAEPVIRLAIANRAEDAEGSHSGEGNEIALLMPAAEDYAQLAALDQAVELAIQGGDADDDVKNDFAMGDSLDAGTLDAAPPILSDHVDMDSLAGGSAWSVDVDSELYVEPEAFRSHIDGFIRSENIETQALDYSETGSELLAVNAVHHVETTLNLLQGDYRPVSANAENRRFIRKAGFAVAACIGVFLFFTLAGGFYLNYQADRYFDDSVAIYRAVFPKQRKVFDPVKQMQSQLSGKAVGGTTSDFLPLLDAASKSLANLDIDTPAMITQLRYDSQRGNITIDLRAGNIDELEAYKDQLTAEGLKVDILSANQDNDIVSGRIQIGRS